MAAPDMKRIAVLMRAQREQHNLNQADYGKRIGLSQAQISKLEAGTLRVLTVYVANVLERQFGELPSLKDDEVVVRMVEHYQTWERDQLTTLTAADCREIIDGLGHMVRIMAKQRQEQSDAPLAPVDPGML